jgi:peptidoglycan/xylan/chitin deacetylase (PgdA/CDA1 family)
MAIPVLMYHELSKEKELIAKQYTITQDQFNSHLTYLYEHGYAAVTVKDYVKSLMDPSTKIPSKCVIITFDDGHESDFTLSLPVLKKYNYAATYFVTTDWIDESRYMSKLQLQTLKAEGMDIQSHAKTHSYLDTLSEDAINSELDCSRKRLEDILQEEISFISLPGGRYNQRVINCAKALGFTGICTSYPFFKKKDEDIFIIGRYGITQRTNKKKFELVVSNDDCYILKSRALYWSKYLLKKLLGNQIYYFLWERTNIIK